MHEHIEQNPAVCHGKPVIKGIRVLVSTIFGAFTSGDTIDTILEDYPTLERADVEAALAYADDHQTQSEL